MQRNFITSHAEEVIEAQQRMLIAFQARHLVPPGAYEMMSRGLGEYAAWLRQSGIGLEQPDIDEP